MARSRLSLILALGRLSRLVVADCRRLAFAARFRSGALDACDRVMGDGVLVADICE
jgi:hypothetical protein